MNSFVKAAGAGFIALGLLNSTALAQDSWWKTAAQPLQGATIRGISESTPASKYVEQVLGPKFTAETGIKVEFEATSWDQMYDKAIKDMEANTGIYDFVYIEQDIVYTYLARNFLVDITKSLADNPKIASPDFKPDNFTTFLNYFKDPKSGDVMGVPMEAFIKPYLYRKDLFDDPAIQKAYKDATGADLKPATTHEEYTQIAKFFTEYGKDKELWGSTVQAASSHPASFYEFFESIAPTFGVYNWGIDGTTFAASVANGGQMNSDAAKKALNYWVGLLQYAPPESTSSTWDEVAGSFAAGRAAQGLVYGENAAWIATDANKSTVVGKVGVALPPVEPGVMEAAEAGKGYIGYYDGGAFGIPHSSKNKDAALLFLQYIGQPSVQTDWALAGSRIVMNSTYDDPKIVEQDKAMNGYYSLMREDGKLFAGAPPYPFHAQVLQVAAPFIYKAIVGEIKPDEALDQAAAAAEAELQKLGYRK
ncbi:extracellular solute-binding protein [Mesorhizobium sp. BE184]|uniref:extracellular solute-binding protein n=1 Tax=unclassified Mesorhizobium TaxID=325217 RepID=UPI0006FE1296|nr:sugar ABC transporter substrate-binding protein [Mesorhizobium sp. Root1471]KQZ37234.1 sugar ABC transporter substrate-binding protein [Mesorhizobium sp. Root554]MDR7034264.1 multiple sugar transport system substrate-binding protein [Mesorhizobium sp. BE184]